TPTQPFDGDRFEPDGDMDGAGDDEYRVESREGYAAARTSQNVGGRQTTTGSVNDHQQMNDDADGEHHRAQPLPIPELCLRRGAGHACAVHGWAATLAASLANSAAALPPFG